MRPYASSALRNVAFVGHGASGKTSLVDALAYVSGSSRRHGSVKDGTTLTDSSPDEIQRQHSIGLGLAHAEWLDHKLNLLDTPGTLDYFGEVVAATSVADAAVVVVGGTTGVEVGTERAYERCDALHLPRLLFVSQMDKEHADFDRVFEDIRAHLTRKVLPVEIPVGDGKDFHGIINLFSGHCHFYRPGTRGEYDIVPIPPEYQARFTRYSEQLMETVAATDDGLIERYLAGEPIAREEVLLAMKGGMLSGEIVPLFCGSATQLIGMRPLLKKMVELFPSPCEVQEAGIGLFHGDGGHADAGDAPWRAAPLVARVFKTVSEPHVGDVSLFRLYAGAVKNNDEVWNAEHEVSERLAHLSVQQGKERLEVEQLAAGDIGSVAKLKDTHTGDTFCRREQPVRLPPLAFPEAVAVTAIGVKNRGEEDRLAAGLHRLHEEDPSFHFEYASELGQTLVHGQGERHFETLVARLERQFNVHAELSRPRVAYRETFRATAEGQGKHKKQSGGRGQYGDCWVRLIPQPRGTGYAFTDEIVGGVVPSRYLPAIDRGIREAAERGPVAGYPVVDFRAECYDGSHHDVDSNEASFRMAAILAFRQVAAQARPVLLEPLREVEIWTPEALQGDVLGDLSARRGQILGTEADGRLVRIRAIVPEAELYRYATTLYSITHGRGHHRERFHGYAEAPPEVAARVARERG